MSVSFISYFFSQSLESPKQTANTCTHKAAVSFDPAKVLACKSIISDQGSCKANPDCEWTPEFGIENEKMTCTEASKIIEVKSDKAYTSSTCNDLCNSSEFCINYVLGRIEGFSPNSCTLLKHSCILTADPNWDYYVASPTTVPPSKEDNVCTHRPVINSDKRKRNDCKAFGRIDTCVGDCQFVLKCGSEKLVIVDPTLPAFMVRIQKPNGPPFLTFDLSEVWKVDTTGLLFNPSDCPITKFKLCNDKLCAEESNESWHSFWG